MNKNIIWTHENKRFRIVEIEDTTAQLEDLKGDTFNRAANPDIPEERLAREEKDFEDLVEREGVFGYVLETWNPEPDCGWEHVESCWGFIGRYSPDDKSGIFDHYIVNELKELAK